MDAQITTIIKLLHDIQSLRSKPPPIQNRGAVSPTAPSFAPRPPPIQNRGAVGPTEPSFAPRDNSGQTSTPNMPSTAEEYPGQETRRTACYGYQPKKALLQVLPVIVHGKDGKQTEVLAMLDSGCDCTLISAGKAYELGLVPDQENSQKVTITGVNGTNTVPSITIPQPIYLSSVKDPYRKFALHDVQTISALPGPSIYVSGQMVRC